MQDSQLIKAAAKLANAMDKVADENLPKTLADIVKLHAKIAVGTAFIPIPGADMVAAGTNVWAMYVRINKELALPFTENMVKSVAAGAATNIGGAAAALVIMSSAFKFIPGLGSLGGAAVMAGTVYALTIVSGIVYMNVVASLLERKAAGEISERDLNEAVKRQTSDKAAMKKALDDAKKGYDPKDKS